MIKRHLRWDKDSSQWVEHPQPHGLGDVVEKMAKPIARALGLDCLDQTTGELKPESKCAQRRKWLNRKFPAREAKGS